MALNIGESNALATLLRALGVNVHGRPDTSPLREGQLLVALGTLTTSAGKALRVGWDPDDLRALAARLTFSGLLPTQADVFLLAAIRDQSVHIDSTGSSLLQLGPQVGTDVTAHAGALTRQGWITPSSIDRQRRRQLLTVAGRRVLEVADPTRCHYVNLAGRACRRSGPHEDWVCNFEPLADDTGLGKTTREPANA
jgi:hypothetical protein